jgi:glycosyltransferase involved in cell wall biosynthesis
VTAVSYIVSAYERPDCLTCCLASLKLQTDHNLEVIVADNGTDPVIKTCHRLLAEQDTRFRYVDSSKWASKSPGFDCYWSAEEIVERGIATGEYICLPSDDSYYTPVFQEAMLAKARAEDLGLVYCNMLYDRRIGGKYSVLNVRPVSCGIDKTGFIVRRDCWIGFPNKPHTVTSSCCDGEMIEELVSRGVRHGKVEEVLVVHN